MISNKHHGDVASKCACRPFMPSARRLIVSVAAHARRRAPSRVVGIKSKSWPSAPPNRRFPATLEAEGNLSPVKRARLRRASSRGVEGKLASYLSWATSRLYVCISTWRKTLSSTWGLPVAYISAVLSAEIARRKIARQQLSALIFWHAHRGKNQARFSGRRKCCRLVSLREAVT